MVASRVDRAIPAQGFVGAEAGRHGGQGAVVGNGEGGGVGEVGANVGDDFGRTLGAGFVDAGSIAVDG